LRWLSGGRRLRPGGPRSTLGTAPGIGGSLILLALFGVSQIGVALGFALLLRSFPGLAGAESPHAMAVKLGMPVTVIASHLITWLGVYFLVARWHGASFIKELRLEQPSKRPVMLALGGGLLLQILGAMLVWLLPPPPDYVPPLRDFLLLGPWAIALLFLFAVLMAPLLEEVLFRGLLLPALRRRYAFPFSALVVTLLFTAMHLGQSGSYWPPLVGIAACGWFLAWWRERSGSLWPSIAFHLSFNLTALLPIIVLSLLGYPIDQLALVG
jgi:membrane protease YdiL (CAAX protease family)